MSSDTLRAKLKGTMTALVTPFNARAELDGKALERLILRQLDAGIDALIPCGTTGESVTLSEAETAEVIATTVRLARGRALVIAGTGSNSTQKTIANTQKARTLGADCALVVTPYYNKPTQEGLYRHFRAVAEAAELPIVAYNVPGRTSVDLLPDTVQRLVNDVPLLVGLKEATGNLARAQELRARLGGRIALLSGDNPTVLPFLCVGGVGVISVTANVDPKGMVALVAAQAAGDLARAQKLNYELWPLHEVLLSETNPIPSKAALHLLGLCEDVLRPPLYPMSSDKRSRLAEVLKQRELELP